MSKFTLMWSNNATFTRTQMSKQNFTLRDHIGGGDASHGGLTGKALHLDQVHIWFRPSAMITAPEFVTGDSADYNWRVETYQLLVRVTPGQKFTYYTIEQGTQGGDTVTSRRPERNVIYSTAMAVTPAVQGAEDYWCRTYRPIRDMPVSVDLENVSQLSVEMMFPMLFQAIGDTDYTSVPDYRILRVVFEFSLDH